MRTIKVTGKGHIRVKPDMTRINITLDGLYPDYAETLRHSSEDTESLKEVLSAFGFERSDLKTLSFNVDTEYESYRENDAYKQRLVGYRFRHMLRVDFVSDNDRLGRILYALGNCELKPEFSISYTVKEPETVKNELLGKAVSDAKAKAAVIASAADVMLKDIQSIDYSWGKMELEVTPMNRSLMKACVGNTCDNASYDLDIEPDDIDVADTVTVVWEIA